MTSGRPWVDLRHGGDKITVLIEDPDSIRYRSNGSRYVDAVLSLERARILRDNLSRRIAELDQS